MLEPFRSEFNARWNEAKYAELRARLDRETRSTIEFPVCETPCFFDRALMERIVKAGEELTMQLVGNAEYLKASAAAVPEAWRVPHEDAHPHFMTVDFGLVRDERGELEPKLVELQAFPSVFGYQAVLLRAYAEVYGIDAKLEWFFGGMDEDAYWAKLREVIVGDHAPENVVLAEVTPELQKTLPDFHVHEDRLGIRTVDIAKLVKHGRQLFYRDAGRLVPVERIYNRAIVDDLVRNRVELGFDYRDDLDVTWAGHPNWYFRVSKFSLPFLRHVTVPKTVFLDEWMAGTSTVRLPEERERWVLKPLYSFAGKGVSFAPTDAELDAIQVDERRNYLLQERVAFEPVIATPEGMTQAEVRILYVWPDGGVLTPMTTLVRMGRGLMMGVDHNKGKRWVGGSAGMFAGH